MTPVTFPEQNDVLRAPKGQEDNVLDLPILRTQEKQHNGDIFPKVVSAWKPTHKELILLMDGGLVYFHCYGHTHPPVLISAEKLE